MAGGRGLAPSEIAREAPVAEFPTERSASMFNRAAVHEAIVDEIVRSPSGNVDCRWARNAALEKLGPGA